MEYNRSGTMTYIKRQVVMLSLLSPGDIRWSHAYTKMKAKKSFPWHV